MLPRLLFWMVCTIAAGLLALLVVAPWLQPSSRLLKLFAEDATVRRTVLGSSLGLFATASVFFRTPSQPTEAPPADAVGA